MQPTMFMRGEHCTGESQDVAVRAVLSRAHCYIRAHQLRGCMPARRVHESQKVARLGTSPRTITIVTSSLRPLDGPEESPSVRPLCDRRAGGLRGPLNRIWAAPSRTRGPRAGARLCAVLRSRDFSAPRETLPHPPGHGSHPRGSIPHVPPVDFLGVRQRAHRMRRLRFRCFFGSR